MRDMLLGYARGSKRDDQDPAAQVRALEAAGCRRIFREAASGGRWDRQSCTACSTSSERKTSSWSGSSTACHAR